MTQEPDITVIYIAGASRSGSTLIEDYVARRFGGLACGEFYRISQFAIGSARKTQEVGAKETCACGSPVSECAFWRAVSREAEINLANTNLRSSLNSWQRFLFRLCVTLLGGKITKRVATLIPVFQREVEVGENCFRVFQAISSVAKVNLIIDSSKQSHQYYILKAVAPERLRLVTLTRDARAVVTSMIRGARGDALAHRIKASTGRMPDLEDVINGAFRIWMRMTLLSLIAFACTDKRRRTVLRYEAFCEDPVTEMGRLERHFSLTKGKFEFDSHAIGGSPSRHTLGFDSIRSDNSWKRQDLDFSNNLSTIPALLLNHLLGYKRILSKEVNKAP